MAEDLHPNRRAKDHQNHGGQQPKPAAYHGSASGQLRPVHRQQYDREVTAGGDGEGQTHHEGDVLIFKQNPQQNRHHAQHQNGDFRHPQLIALAGALAEDVSIQVVRNRRGAGQRQAGDHRQNSGEGDR